MSLRSALSRVVLIMILIALRLFSRSGDVITSTAELIAGCIRRTLFFLLGLRALEQSKRFARCLCTMLCF